MNIQKYNNVHIPAIMCICPNKVYQMQIIQVIMQVHNWENFQYKFYCCKLIIYTVYIEISCKIRVT